MSADQGRRAKPSAEQRIATAGARAAGAAYAVATTERAAEGTA